MQPAIIVLMLCVLWAAQSAQAAAQTAPPAEVVVLIRADAMPPRQARAASAEVRTIWRRAGVTVRWTTAIAEDQQDEPAAVFVHLCDQLPIGPADSTQPLGALPIQRGQLQPAILISRTAVDQLVVSAGFRKDSNAFDMMSGRLVGRVIAHELGHLLLNSLDHRSAGLMRQRFQLRDVVSDDEARFVLDQRDLAVVRRLTGDAVRAAREGSPSGLRDDKRFARDR